LLVLAVAPPPDPVAAPPAAVGAPARPAPVVVAIDAGPLVSPQAAARRSEPTPAIAGKNRDRAKRRCRWHRGVETTIPSLVGHGWERDHTDWSRRESSVIPGDCAEGTRGAAGKVSSEELSEDPLRQVGGGAAVDYMP